MQNILKYPAVFAVGLIVTYWLTPVFREAARFLGVVDDPGGRCLHTGRSVPSGGGVAVFLGFHAACAAIFLLPWMPFSGQIDAAWWRRYLAASAWLLAVGIADDVTAVRASVKLAGQVMAAVLAFVFDMRLGTLLGIHLPAVIDLVCTVLWFLAFINAFNLIDGMDGLAAGLAALAGLGLAGSFLLRRMPGDALVVLGFTGACVAFLRYNFHPASVFLGDSGSMFLGFTLAAIAVSTGAKGTTVATLGVPLLAAGIPFFDTLLAIWRRAVRVRRAGSSVVGVGPAIFSPDKDHLHHRLIGAGRSQRAVAGWLYVSSAVLIGVGLLSMVFHSQALGIYIVAFVVASYIAVRHIARVELWDSGAAILDGLSRPPTRVMGVVLYPPLDALLLMAAFALTICFGPAGGPGADLKKVWLDRIPLWVGMPFLAMAVFGVYRRVWSRARISEYAYVVLVLVAGIALTGGVAGIVGRFRPFDLVRQIVLYAGLAVPLITGVRAFPRAVQDAMAWRAGDVPGPGPKRTPVLVYGAGSLCTLFLRDRAVSGAWDPRTRRIVGLLDEDRNLYGRVVFGYKVLGGADRLRDACRDHRVEELVITDPPPADVLKHLLSAAADLGVRVQRWRPRWFRPTARPETRGCYEAKGAAPERVRRGKAGWKMRGKAKKAATAVILGALMLNCSCRLMPQETQRWRIGTPIATYYAGPAMTNAVAEQMREGGFNLVWAAEKELDVARRYGLRALLREDGLLNPQSLEDPAARARLDSLIARVKTHPALYGYYLIDEPAAGTFPGLGKLVAYLREQDPAHVAYINLFPTYASNEQLGVTGETIAAYQEYLRRFIETVKPELLSYDHYHFTVTGDEGQYFLNLGLIRQAALDAGMPFLNIVQACSWAPHMRVPNGDEMRWLHYTSLAYGAQGISYYVYSCGGHEGGMARLDGSTTPQYEAAKVLNREFVAVASQLQPLRSQGSYHVGKVPWGAQALPDQTPFRLDPEAPGSSPMPAEGMLLGYFGKAGSGKSGPATHVVVVNLDYRNAVTATVVGPGRLDVFDATAGKWKRASGPRAALALPPGGGVLVRVRD